MACWCNIRWWTSFGILTHHLVITQYGIKCIGQQWLRWWIVAWRHQIAMPEKRQDMMEYHLKAKLYSLHVPGDNELMWCFLCTKQSVDQLQIFQQFRACPLCDFYYVNVSINKWMVGGNAMGLRAFTPEAIIRRNETSIIATMTTSWNGNIFRVTGLCAGN